MRRVGWPNQAVVDARRAQRHAGICHEVAAAALAEGDHAAGRTSAESAAKWERVAERHWRRAAVLAGAPLPLLMRERA